MDTGDGPDQRYLLIKETHTDGYCKIYPFGLKWVSFCSSWALSLRQMAFGDFAEVCRKAPLPLCTLITPLGQSQQQTDATAAFTGVLPLCYARTVDLANTLIFEVGTAFMNIGNLVVLLMITYLIRQRYTSVARKEMLVFFWGVIVNVMLLLVVNTGVTPPGSTSYGYFVAAEIAMEAVCCWTLFFAGLCSFNLWDDGSKKVMAYMYCSAAAVFVINYFVAIFTFKGWGDSLGPSNTTALYVFMFVLNPVLLGAWLVCQLFVCTVTLMFNWWAVGALCLSTFFFAVSQVLLYRFSYQICTHINHYVDGTLFSSLSMMFCYMMVYKYWEIVTFDDDEYYRYTEMVSGFGSKEEAKSLLN